MKLMGRKHKNTNLIKYIQLFEEFRKIIIKIKYDFAKKIGTENIIISGDFIERLNKATENIIELENSIKEISNSKSSKTLFKLEILDANDFELV